MCLRLQWQLMTPTGSREHLRRKICGVIICVVPGLVPGTPLEGTIGPKLFFLFHRNNTLTFLFNRNIHMAVPFRPRGAPASSPAWSGMRRPRRVCGPFARRRTGYARSREVVKGRRPADGVGGPRTQQCGDTKHSVKAPSTWRRWELQADKTVACGTLAKSFAGGPVQSSNGLNHCPCAISTRDARMKMRAPRARFSPSRSARPLRRKAREDRQALEPDQPWGDDVRPEFKWRRLFDN